MSFGLKIWNPAGELILNTDDRFTREHLTVHLYSSLSWQFFPVEGMAPDGTWLVVGAGKFISIQVSTGGFYYMCNSSYWVNVYLYLVMRT